MSSMFVAASVASHSTRVSTRVLAVPVCFGACTCVQTVSQNIAVLSLIRRF